MGGPANDEAGHQQTTFGSGGSSDGGDHEARNGLSEAPALSDIPEAPPAPLTSSSALTPPLSNNRKRVQQARQKPLSFPSPLSRELHEAEDDDEEDVQPVPTSAPKRTSSAPPTSATFANRRNRHQKRVSLPSFPKHERASSLILRRQPLEGQFHSLMESLMEGEASLLDDFAEQEVPNGSDVDVDDDDDKDPPECDEPQQPSLPSRSLSVAHSTHRHKFQGSSNIAMEEEDNIMRSSHLEQPQDGQQRMGGMGGDKGSESLRSGSCRDPPRSHFGYLYMLLFNNPRLVLQRQLMLSFGTIGLLMIAFIIGASSVVTLNASRTITGIHHRSLRDLWINNVQVKSARYMSDLLTSQLLPYDIVQLLYETTRDRYAGYPNVQRNGRTTNFDQYVPFTDYYTKERRYPIQGPRLLLDWETSFEVDQNTSNRNSTSPPQIVDTTQSGVYGMQGMCDPENDDPTSETYYPNCSADNNNILTGGSVQPTVRNKMIYDKARDIVPLLKSLYEYHHDTVHDLGVYFKNDGAGSFVSYPHSQLNASSTYISEGCDWMVETLNPLKREKLINNSSIIYNIPTIGTYDEAQRCHKKGTVVSARDYNALERRWCQKQAVANPKTTGMLLHGPFIDAWDNNRKLVSVGRAVYDRVTDEFIACLYVGFSMSTIEETIVQYTVYGSFEVTVVKFDGRGTVLASTASLNSSLTKDDIFDISDNEDSHIHTIDRYDVGVSKDSFKELRNLVPYAGLLDDYSESSEPLWVPHEVENLYETHILERDGFKTLSYPIPPVPPDYDEHYMPDFLVIVSIREETYQEYITDVDDEIRNHSNRAIVVAITTGAVGFLLIIMMIALTSHTITVPLASMNRIAKQIVNSFGENRDGSIPVAASASAATSSRSLTEDKRISASERTSSITPGGLGRRMSTTDLMPKILKRKSSKIQNNPKHYLLRMVRKVIPRTELGEMKEEFNKMVVSFSGRSMMAKSTKQSLFDVMNTFDLLRDDKFLQELYKSRQDSSANTFTYQISIPNSNFRSFPSRTSSDVNDGGFCHLGSIIVPSPETDSTSSNQEQESEEKTFEDETKEQMHKNRFKSPLFVSILLMIVLPLLVVVTCISVVVVHRISTEFIKSLENAEDSYIEIELNALQFYATVRAKWASMDTAVSVRNSFLLTRYLSWLLFGGLNRTDSFTELVSGIDECKGSGAVEECDFYKENFVCDCAWHDSSVKAGVCQDYDVDTRYLQKTFFASQASDADTNGNRNSTTFPNHSYSPATTMWWSDIDQLPGSENRGSLASGYETSYDRLRVASSVPLYQVLYNYDEFKSHALGVFVGFEADGLFVGYNGCRLTRNAGRSRWVSSESNGAEKLRPELCPKGKYGYDPRCREWYHTTKNLSLDKDYAVYVAAPFFGATGIYEQSASSPLVDPVTGTYVGAVLITFKSETVTWALKNYTKLAKDGFPILITPQPSQLEKADTVIGPGLSLQEESKPIVPLVLPYDQNCSSSRCRSNIDDFEYIVDNMRAGKQNLAEFTRRTADGANEVVYISYSPVYVKSYRPVDASDFYAGVEGSEYLVYSLALAETRGGLLLPFDNAHNQTRLQIVFAAGIVGILIFAALCCVVYISDQLTLSLTKPTTSLLKLARRINRLELDDPPKLDRSAGSKEIMRFSTTMETLYKVVKVVNAAYFAGDLEKAYAVLSDALRLFKRLDNRKAVGVASNNLGNVMLAMYRRMKSTNEKVICGLTMKSIVTRGLKYYLDAIRLGEAAYDDFYENEGWTPKCLDFMQHLSNRYFNRAIFLLTVKDSHDSPDELEQLGLRDLQISQDMDVEIIDQGEETGWGRFNRAEALLETALTRARGYISLAQMGYEHDEYIEEILDGAFDLVKKQMKKADSDLFREIRPTGRLQQVETEVIRYHKLKGNSKVAAMVAIRMLLEDEYIFPTANKEAVSALVRYLASPEFREEEATNFAARRQLRVQIERYELDLLDRLERNAHKQKAAVIIEDDLEVASKYMSNRSFLKDDMSHTSRHTGGGGGTNTAGGSASIGDFTVESMIEMPDFYREDVTMEVF